MRICSINLGFPNTFMTNDYERININKNDNILNQNLYINYSPINNNTPTFGENCSNNCIENYEDEDEDENGNSIKEEENLAGINKKESQKRKDMKLKEKDKERIKIFNEFIKASLNDNNNKTFKKCLCLLPKKYHKFYQSFVELEYCDIFKTTTKYRPGLDINKYENIIIDKTMKVNFKKLINKCLRPCICICLDPDCSYIVYGYEQVKDSPLLRAFKSINQLKRHIEKYHSKKYKVIVNASPLNDEWSLVSFRTNGNYNFIKTHRINYKTIREIVDVKEEEEE